MRGGPQLGKCAAEPEFWCDVNIEIPHELFRRLQHVCASNFVFIVRTRLDPEKTNQLSCLLCDKANSSVGETFRNPLRRTGKVINDGHSRRSKVYPCA